MLHTAQRQGPLRHSPTTGGRHLHTTNSRFPRPHGLTHCTGPESTANGLRGGCPLANSIRNSIHLLSMPLTLGAQLPCFHDSSPSSSRRKKVHYCTLVYTCCPVVSSIAVTNGTTQRQRHHFPTTLVYTRKLEVDSDRFQTRINLNPHTHPGAPVSVRLPRPTLPCI